MTEQKAFSNSNKIRLYLIFHTILATLHFVLDILFVGDNVVTGNAIVRDMLIIVFSIIVLVLFLKNQSNNTTDKNSNKWSVFFLFGIAYHFAYNIYMITMSIITAVMYGISQTYPQNVMLAINAVTVIQAVISIALIVFGVYIFKMYKSKKSYLIGSLKKYRLVFMIHIFVSVAVKFIGEFSDGFDTKDVFVLSEGVVIILIAGVVTLLINEYLNTSFKVQNTFIN